MMIYLRRLAVSAFALKLAVAQDTTSLPAIHSTGWNSSFELSAEQLKLGNLTTDYGAIINTIINFDRSQLANGGTHQDEFYDVQNLPKDQWPTESGRTIKLQKFTNPSSFSIPPKTAMSRIIYSTTNLNGTLIPASAYILWPHHPKSFRGGRNASASSAPVVLWTHGTSGFYADGAPSTHRGLFYEDFVPFTLAEAGYAVVAPDYAGLGVSTSWDGTFIPHQYFASEAGAGDALNALRAAQESFPKELSDDYVVLGHSQGGAVAWTLSEILARKNHKFQDVVKHHLGTVSMAPPTDIFSLSAGIGPFLAWIGKDLDQIFPTFNLSDWLTPLGTKRTNLSNQVEGSQIVSSYLLSPQEEIVQPDWKETWSVEAFGKLANPGNMDFKGPMLVLQGMDDPVVTYNMTKNTVDKTCQNHPNDLEFLNIPKANHFGVINAGKQNWLRWIEDRFASQPLARSGCVKSNLKSLMPQEYYQLTANSFVLWAGKTQWSYEVPTAA
jgi:pimeloyl-ACP methyl ester carboxylesterase